MKRVFVFFRPKVFLVIAISLYRATEDETKTGKIICVKRELFDYNIKTGKGKAFELQQNNEKKILSFHLNDFTFT